jgi:cyclin B
MFQKVRTITRNYLQLVDVGAMFIASKYEETIAPEVGDFVYICDHAYTKDEILQMEKAIMRTLDFSLSRPLPLYLLRQYSKAAHVSKNSHF